MALTNCSLTKIIPYGPFTGCDGKPLSDDFLKERIRTFTNDGRPHLAMNDFWELVRRGLEKIEI